MSKKFQTNFAKLSITMLCSLYSLGHFVPADIASKAKTLFNARDLLD